MGNDGVQGGGLTVPARIGVSKKQIRREKEKE